MNKKQFTILVLVTFISVALVAPAAPALAAGSILADFEGGVPAGWFTFFGSSTVNTTTQVVADSDALARPGQVGDNEILVSDFNVVDFGGFGQDVATALGAPQDWSSFESFSFWFYGTASGLVYQAEISDNRSDPNSDTSERFDYEFTDNTFGWQLISIPFADFTRATDFQPGGAPDDGFTLTEIWAWAIVLPQGVDTVYFDDFSLGQRIVDDFESGLPSGTDTNGIPIGFFTAEGAGSSVVMSTSETPPAPELPALGTLNHVLQADFDVTSWAVLIHAFENEAVDTWVPQDWSAYEGFAFWIHGSNSGTELFIDLLENRNPGSTTDDAERWTVTFADDFEGWQYLQFPFTNFVRKDVGNDAPNDGFTLDEVHGWAFGTLGTGGPQIYYLDQVSLYGVAPERPLEVTFSASEYKAVEGTNPNIEVKLTRPLKEDDPDQVSVDYSTDLGSAIVDRDYTPTAGTLTFVKGGPSKLTFTIETFDNAKHDGDKTVLLRLSDPVDVPLGYVVLSRLTILDDDPFDPLLIEDFERDPDLFDSYGGVSISRLEIPAGDPLALPGQGAYEGVLNVVAPLAVDIDIMPGSDGTSICNSGTGVVPVAILTTETFDALTVDHTTVSLGDAYEAHVDKKTGVARRHVEDIDGDGDMDLIFHFVYAETSLGCDPAEAVLNGSTFDGQPITAGGDSGLYRDFPLGEDWSAYDGLNFWYYGTGSGDTVALQLKDNRAPDPGPSGWNMVWSDEFDDPAGTSPNPANWTHEIGDGTINGNPGWGNSELQYYTDSTENSAMDGEGNLVITAAEADGSLLCYYGPCEYTSARLISWYKAEFAYGRIESRLRVPEGAGLWPAFWTLGTDIGEVDWPQSGEIDIMEFVGREPNEIFGTIHGPGYSGGQSFGGTYTFNDPVYDDFHTFAIEWEPDLIRWYVDDILYHEAIPDDVAPNEWVFNHPFFIILNVAVGGNFGGPVGEDTTFPQELAIDYLRVYQGPDTAERWQASFVDDFTGWQQVSVPFASFTRSAEQPAGAPDDGLNLTEVWGYGFGFPGGTSTGSVLLDQVRLPAPNAVTVVNTNDSGPGSLRNAIASVAVGGTVTFDASLAGGTITLTSGPLVLSKDINISGSGAPDLTISGGGVERVFIIDAGVTATLSDLVIADGYGWQLAGGILNNGNLTLDHVTVTGNTMATDAGDFWQGGGGIYSGEGATLTLVDSSVVDNLAAWSGGGVYSFFNTTTNIMRSTIAGNVSGDVGGGLRLLGNAEIVNSTISNNEALGWYGGALFITDGVVEVLNSTIAGNISPSWAPEGIFVGTFGPASATLTFTNSIIANATGGCFIAPWGSGTVTLASGGHNIGSDDTCNLTAVGDQPNTDPLVGPLADNGGPTLTHALLTGSPAIDAGDDSVCPATDQRGVSRPQGAACDVGAYELVP